MVIDDGDYDEDYFHFDDFDDDVSNYDDRMAALLSSLKLNDLMMVMKQLFLIQNLDKKVKLDEKCLNHLILTLD